MRDENEMKNEVHSNGLEVLSFLQCIDEQIKLEVEWFRKSVDETISSILERLKDIKNQVSFNENRTSKGTICGNFTSSASAMKITKEAQMIDLETQIGVVVFSIWVSARVITRCGTFELYKFSIELCRIRSMHLHRMRCRFYHYNIIMWI